MIKFTVQGQPKGKGRPRFSKRGNYVHAYTPEDTTAYENQVAFAYISSSKTKFTGNVEMEIRAYYKIVKSTNKTDKELMLKHIIRPTKKPDLDNVIKIILDGLNGYAYNDDAQVCKVTAEKWYSDEPRVEVTIRGVE